LKGLLASFKDPSRQKNNEEKEEGREKEGGSPRQNVGK
jgi:hypothetical protein